MDTNEFKRLITISADQYINSLKNVDQSKTKLEFRPNKNYETLLFCNRAFIRIKNTKKDTTLEIKKDDFSLYELKDYISKTSDPLWGTVLFNDDVSAKIISNITKALERCYLSQAPESFGCCSRYEECSDKKTCVHPDIKFASGCYYKTNLESGRIFYGKNRNIDNE